MPTFAWVLFSILGLGVLFGLAYAIRALNGWVFKIDDMLKELRAIRAVLDKQ